MNWGQSVGRMSMKRNKVRKIGISLVTTAILVIGTLSGIPMHAHAATNYPLNIGGYQFTSSRLVIDSSVDSAFSGSATYDPGSNTLTLNNFNNGGKVSMESSNSCYGMRYQGNDDLMICIVGNNTITTDMIPSNAIPSKWGIISQSDEADITFQGTTIDDSLSVYSGDSTIQSVITQSIGIESAGNMLINDCSINAIAGNANSWIGGIKIFDSGHPFAHLNLTVDHACVTARGGNLLGDGSVAGDRFTATVGIHSHYSIIIQNESIVVASAGTKNKTDSSSDGISASNEIQISNSKVDAAAQGGIAIYNTIKNEVPGLGWTNFVGTEGETSIQVNPSGQTLYTYQKVHFAPINTVTVTNGTCVGGDDHEYGETVTITANAPAAGCVFDHWSTSSGVTFANANSSTTTFAMPAAPVSVTANYRELDRATVAQIPTAKTGLTVNGSAQALINGGSATGGTLVYALGNADSATGTYSETIPTEMNAGTYYVWYKVVGDSNHNDTEAKMLTVQIAEKNETDDPNNIDPKSDSAETYTVTVTDGTGGGNFAAGATVTISAGAAPAGKEFDKWTTSDGVTFADANAASTTFTMPAKAVTVTATYRDIPDPLITPAPAAPVKEEATINEKPVKIEAEFTYPQAVTWTGKKITKEQLGVLADDGQAVKVTITGLADAIANMKPNTDPTKLYSIVYDISGKDVGSGTFTIKIKLNNKALKKAKIKGDDKTALVELVNKLNEDLAKDVHSFKVAPIDLSNNNESVKVTIKATLKKKKVQVNEEDGTIKGLKSVTITYKVPAGKNKNGKPKYKTQKYTYKKNKVNGKFVINVTDAAGKKVSVTATADNQTFSGTRTDVMVKK